MPEEPANPFSQLAQAAVALHEIFTAYVDAGFARAEALHIVTAITVAALQKHQPPGEQPPSA